MYFVNNHDLMVEGQATVTKRGQITIPASVRRFLRIGPYDKVVFGLDPDGRIQIAPATTALESAYGSVTPITRPENFETIAEIAKDDKVERSYQ